MTLQREHTERQWLMLTATSTQLPQLLVSQFGVTVNHPAPPRVTVDATVAQL